MDDKTIEQLQEELALSEQKAQEQLEGWQRARADYSNLKKEQEKRAQEMAEFINASTLAELLPIYSHFKLALAHIPETSRQEPWVVGITQIQKLFQEFLKKYSVEEIKTSGEKFDHNLHEALVHEAKEGFQPEVIFEEIQPGYLVDGKVLVPAKVKVAK
jgi:molecular chaperone GrpE